VSEAVETKEAAAPAGEARAAADAPVRRRRRWPAVLAVLLVVLALDLAQPPADQLSARFLLAGIDLYQATLSPRLGATGVRCRFEPSCSRYAEGAIREDGALVGSARAAWRIARCGPWTPSGTVDPP
jgi:putative membrane protein insertion efficiency factor